MMGEHIIDAPPLIHSRAEKSLGGRVRVKREGVGIQVTVC